MEKCVSFINEFLKLDFFKGDIEKLRDFSFLNLAVGEEKIYNKIKLDYDIKEKYGNFTKIIYKTVEPKYIRRNNNFEDCDDMNLARAIYYVLYHDRLKNLSYNDIKWEIEYRNDDTTNNFRGETINSFKTLINENNNWYNYEKFFRFDKELVKEIIPKFRDKVYTIGNFMMLPNIFHGGFSINTYKGICLGDYSDRFLETIKSKCKNNEFLREIIFKNKPYSDEMYNFDEFISINCLQDYVNNDELTYCFEPYYSHWNYKNIDDDGKKIYANFIKKYIKIATKLIDLRFDRIKYILKERL